MLEKNTDDNVDKLLIIVSLIIITSSSHMEPISLRQYFALAIIMAAQEL